MTMIYGLEKGRLAHAHNLLFKFMAARAAGASGEELKRLAEASVAALPKQTHKTPDKTASAKPANTKPGAVVDIDDYLREREAEAKRAVLQREWDDA